MSESIEGVTTGALIGMAKEHGYSVSESQLERWRRLGLLPKPIARPGRGRGRGRVGVYPIVAGRQLLALLQIRHEDRRAEYWGWRLWGEGFDVLRFVRPQLVGYFAELENRVKETLRAFEAGDVDNAIEQASSLHLDRKVDGLRRRVHPDRFPTLVRIYFELFSGRFNGAWLEAEDFEILAKVWNDPKQRESMTESPAETKAALRNFAEFLNPTELRKAAESASDEDLLQVRDEARTFLGLGARPLPVTFGVYLFWFVARKGSKKISAFVEEFLTDASLAEERAKMVNDWRQNAD